MSNEHKTQEALLQAIGIMIDQKLRNLGFNYYVDGVIKNDNKDGTYNVLINGKTYNNVPSQHKLTYFVNDTVQVLIKNGDWNKKFIDDKSYHNNYMVASQYNSVDPDGKEFPMISQNNKNLWIGSYQSDTRHHRGKTYISSGYDGEKGNESIYVSVPNESNTGATNYKVMHLGNLDETNDHLKTYLEDNLKTYLLDSVYPVGSIYMSVNNVSPATFLGGTWVAWGSGKVPVGVNASETEFKTVEKTGGAKTHTLTTNEMPKHTHSISTTKDLDGQVWNIAVQASEVGVDADGVFTGIKHDSSGAPYAKGGVAFSTEVDDGFKIDVNHNHTATETGGGSAHNNLQPYITCYMWKRTA